MLLYNQTSKCSQIITEFVSYIARNEHRISAIIVHYGDATGGHYVSFVHYNNS